MRQHEEKELEESLEYMRQQFQSLTEGIPIPGSLRADLLKKQLEQMEAEQEEAEQEVPRQRKVLPFSSRALLGVAACLAVVSLSMLSYQMGKSSSGAMDKLAPDQAVSSSAASAMPSAAPAAPDESDEVMAIDGDMPVADLPADMQVMPDAAMASPASPEFGAEAPSAFSAPVPEEEKSTSAAEEAAPQAVSAAPKSAPTAGAAAIVPVNDGIADVWRTYLPETLPRGLSMVYSAQGDNTLTVSYLSDDYSRQIQMTLRTLTSQLAQNQVEIDQPETYDLRMYEPPYSNTVPQGLAETVNNPVFRWEDMDEDVVASRVFASNGVFGQEQGNFCVLFATGIVAELNVTGVTSVELFDMLEQMYL